MIVLGIDTATRTASVGLLDGDRQIAERRLPGARTLAATILPLVQDTLAAASCQVDALDLIAVSVGPGSFTGLRIGLSVAKGLALSTRRPVIGVPTLEALANAALDRGGDHRSDEVGYEPAIGAAGGRRGIICPVLDARRGEVYGALFHSTDGVRIERLTADVVAEPQTFAAEIGRAAVGQACAIIGDGGEQFRALWERIVSGRIEILPFSDFPPRGMVVAELGLRLFIERGADAVESLVPRYCRASDAERKRLSVMGEGH